MNEELKEIYNNLNTSQDKYTYFLLAAAITAIGFTITQTQNLVLKISEIPLAVSVVFWGLSFFFGCRNREYYNATLYGNFDLLKIRNGTHELTGDNLQLIQVGYEELLKIIKQQTKKA